MPVYALVLTSPPTAPALSQFAVERAWSLISEPLRRNHGWLADREAWAGEFVTNEDGATASIKAAVKRALLGLTIDINVVTGDAQSRRKRLLVADMDSTIIEQECIDEMADMLGLRDKIAAITERAMRGELAFEAALEERLALLEGLDERTLERVFNERITLMPGATTLVATMRKHGATTALVSGGFSFFTSRVRRSVGFDADHSNTLAMAGGKLTGRVEGPILGREAKLATLERYRADLGLQAAETLAVGDGANDLAMIKAAGLGVAYRAKPVVAAEADAAIIHGDLTALLFLQGYRRDEFAT
jgi:phosphoserine phosphatase